MTSSREEMKRMLESVQKVIRARTVNTSANNYNNNSFSGSSSNNASFAEHADAIHNTTTIDRDYYNDNNSYNNNNISNDNNNQAYSSTDGDYTLPLHAVVERKRTTFNTLNARDNEKEFVEYYYRTLYSFVQDKSRYEMELPNLSAFDRLVVHALAEKCNLSHLSSGTGEERTLHIKKDTLFFQQPNAAKEIDLADILHKVKSKESKFHLKRARVADPAELESGEIGSYADDDALRKIERFRRATDEYRHATEIGMTQEEMALAERNTLPNNSNNNNNNNNVQKQIEKEMPPAATSTITARLEDILRQPTQTEPNNDNKKELFPRFINKPIANEGNETKTFDEVCNGCHVRVRVNYDVKEWKCSKYCAHCARQTIWKLEEVNLPNTNSRDNNAAIITTGHDDINDEKINDIEDAVDEVVTVEDVMEMAAMNDYSVRDMNWIRQFATIHASHLNENIVFCIEFADLLGLHIFTDYDNQSCKLPFEKSLLQGSEEKELLTADCHDDNNVNNTITVTKNTSSNSLYVIVRESKKLGLTVTSLIELVVDEIIQFTCNSDKGEETTESELQETIMCNESKSATLPSLTLANEQKIVSAKKSESLAEKNISDTMKLEKNTSGTIKENNVCVNDNSNNNDKDHGTLLQMKLQHLALAFCNVSVYGVEAIGLCQLRLHAKHAPKSLPFFDIDKCIKLTQKYGSTHFYHTYSLQSAIEYASQLN